ncbi:hypothetical protein KPL35_15105 [Clostridium sp. CF011]|uniref:hypothetical protein n=1 Tax=unclassified Clostridium TaxID=2614128 RepID=UPI001C0C6CD0|nr:MULTISPECIES: hypothetical protein [unclassified Clostridium]MBU3093393.1 hypothetical protein [Clostridium sp. CF011]MBW9146996.1 hypothetical protein [Clostridium sp. CM027]UVE41909.1 hypothetical protein KTC92_05445 [Clostridium sp. CM027]WAG70922.1 hypothetical protein LL036_05680 [Clostridium sp. CF011]
MNLISEGIEKGFVIKTDLSRKLIIDGITENYPVYKVKLDYLFFNNQNDRIATWISQYKADNNVTELDMSDIKAYNDIIQEFICKSNPDAIKKTQANIGLVYQREPGVVLLDGRIIDGNRRVTCLGNLAKDDARFNYFETVILQMNLKNNAKQIKMLELMIQHGEESKVDYNPIDRLVGIYNDIIENELLTQKEYARYTNVTEEALIKQVELAMLLVEFLEMINAPKQFYIARDMDLNGPLVELHGILKKVKGKDEKDEVKSAVFTNFLIKPLGDMTRFIRKIKTIASSKYLSEYLGEQMEIAEKVIDKLPDVGKVTNKVINEVFRSDVDTKEKLKRSLEKAVEKAKSSENRNRPLYTLEKVGDSLETIDTNIFSKLNEEQISAITTQLDNLQELLDVIRLATNV